MITLKKLVEGIDFNNLETQSVPSWEKLGYLFNIYDLYWSEDKRLKCYFIKKWLCTDTWVGTMAYFLDGEFVAISNQEARKSDEIFSFVSNEVATKVRDYLLSLVDKENEFSISTISESDLNSEIPDTYKITYNSQILHKTALLNGERVTIVKTNYPNNSLKYFYTVEIKHENGEKEEVQIDELDFEYNV